jgi:hypothetical protein
MMTSTTAHPEIADLILPVDERDHIQIIYTPNPCSNMQR